MGNYRYEITQYNNIDCLHVITETDYAQDGISRQHHAYIALDSIQRAANIYNGMNKIDGDVELVKPEREALQNVHNIAFAAVNQINYWKKYGAIGSLDSLQAAFNGIIEICEKQMKEN
jgi:hypothetical protein